MLEIFYGRENIDKEAFAFSRIGGNTEATLEALRNQVIIVPDQFKLATERRAMEYLNLSGIIGMEILSLRRLGNKILQESAVQNPPYIDKYGRHIILSDIMAEKAKKLRVYGRMGHRPSFIEILNNLISEMKRFGVSNEKLRGILQEAEMGKGEFPNLLKFKLSDISLIYDEYENRINGKYVDTEDRVNIFLEHIGNSDLVVGKQIWIWGFDWLSPKDLDIIAELIKVADVHIVFTYSESGRDNQIFSITGEMIRKLGELAESQGVTYRKMQIDDEIGVETKTFVAKRPLAIAALERNFFQVPSGKASEEEKQMAEKGQIMLLEAANPDSEAESAAAYILWLLREKNYRYRDIAVICNDTGQGAETIRQQFAEYGLPLFIDKRRSLMNSPVITFILSLINVVSDGWRSEDLFAMLKTGYGPLTLDETERLENYALDYRIEGKRWRESFTKAVDVKEKAELAELEKMRLCVSDFVMTFEKTYKEDRSAEARTQGIYSFLKEGADLPAKLQEKITELEERGNVSEAQILSQVWEQLIKVFSQMIEVMGEKKVSLDRYRNLLTAGLSAVEIGMLPPGTDTLAMGTMQRSRIAGVKAVVILGACEGMLPKSLSSSGILSEDEKKRISEEGTEVGKLQRLRSKEETLAMYRLLSAPSERLYLSYSRSDGDGKETKASEIFNDIADFFGLSPVLDMVSQAGLSEGRVEEKSMKLIQSPRGSIRHMAEAFESVAENRGELPEAWKEVYAWAKENMPHQTEAVLAGLEYSNKKQRLNRELIHKLYPTMDGELKVSPSGFENYSKCPFSFFVKTGLSPEERRNYGMESREVGDIYHECFEALMKRLSVDGKEVCSSDSAWQKIDRKNADKLIDEIFDEKIKNYREGVATSGAEEKYRTSRMRSVLKENTWALLSHVKQGRVRAVNLEESFGRGADSKFSSIKVPTGEENVHIVGKIDRVDELEGGEVKIIDYKSGRKELNPEEIIEGWKLQLMLYLKAVQGEKRPAGVFYYNIADTLTSVKASGSKGGKSLTEVQAELLETMEKHHLTSPDDYAMEGLMVDDGEVLRSIVGTADEDTNIKVVKHCKYVKKDSAWKGRALLKEEEFQEMRESFDKVIGELCKNLSQGDITAFPKKRMKAKPMEEGEACQYCTFKSICKFDTLLSGCDFHKINC